MKCSYEKVLIEHMKNAVGFGYLLINKDKSNLWLSEVFTKVGLVTQDHKDWTVSIQESLGYGEYGPWREITPTECRAAAIDHKLVTDPDQIALFDLELELLDQD